MKTISLLQPWATLVAIGAKKIETRSWSTNYRGPLLIHASKGFSRQQKEICCSEPFSSILFKAGYRVSLTNLPLGMIIAKVNLVDCLLINSNEKLPEPELSFGDYTPGRYAWLLSDVQVFSEPILVKGQLGIWEFNLIKE